MPATVYSFLLRHGADSSKRIKVEEYCIRPQNLLFVLGTLSQNPGIDASVVPAWAGPSAHRIATAAISAKAMAAGDGAASAQPEIVHLSDGSASVPAIEMTQQQKIAAALMKAGISNPAAWAVAGVSPQAGVQIRPSVAAVAPTAEKSAAEEERGDTNETYDLHPPVVLMKGSHDPTFFISWRSQRDLVATLGWKSTLMIWGGPALTLVCVYVLLAHFNLL
jgi:hypothetical protein